MTKTSVIVLSDWYPTLMGLATNKTWRGKPNLDGIDMWDAIINNKPSPRNEIVQYRVEKGEAIISVQLDDLKIILGPEIGDSSYRIPKYTFLPDGSGGEYGSPLLSCKGMLSSSMIQEFRWDMSSSHPSSAIIQAVIVVTLAVTTAIMMLIVRSKVLFLWSDYTRIDDENDDHFSDTEELSIVDREILGIATDGEFSLIYHHDHH